MKTEVWLVVFLRPAAGLFEGVEVFVPDCIRGIFAFVDNDDDLRVAVWPVAFFQGHQAEQKEILIVAGDHDHHPQQGRGPLVNERRIKASLLQIGSHDGELVDWWIGKLRKESTFFVS